MADRRHGQGGPVRYPLALSFFTGKRRGMERRRQEKARPRLGCDRGSAGGYDMESDSLGRAILRVKEYIPQQIYVGDSK